MDEHRAGEETPRRESQVPQHLQDAACSLDGDFVVLRARFAEEVVVRGEVDQRGDVGSMMLTGGAQSLVDTLVGCDRSLTNPAVGARDDDDLAVRIHVYGLSKTDETRTSLFS